MRIPDGSSIFTAEAKAIDLALDLVDNCNSRDKFIIFSDSFSVLQAVNHTSSKTPQIQNILQKHHTISKYKTIVYCWPQAILASVIMNGLTKKQKNL